MHKEKYDANNKLDCTTVADWLIRVSWRDYSHPTAVVQVIYEPKLLLPATVVKSKGNAFIFYNKPS